VLTSALGNYIQIAGSIDGDVWAIGTIAWCLGNWNSIAWAILIQLAAMEFQQAKAADRHGRSR
jgi:hypothetical protein